MRTIAMTAADIARHLGAEVRGDASIKIQGFAPAPQAKLGDLTFAENETYFRLADQSQASAILVADDFGPSSKVLIKVSNARVGFARVLHLLLPPDPVAPGIHPSAVIAGSAVIDPTARVGPLCIVGERTHIGPRTVLRGCVTVGDDCRLGGDVVIFPQVSIYHGTQVGERVRIHSGTVIGADGFGYVLDNGAHLKVPQIGTVIIHDDVEIGSNVSIDRGALGATVIGRGTKIDNLVQVAHNVEVGEHCLLVGQCGVAGSTRLGSYVTLAGQAGIAGHLTIGPQAVVGAQAGVMHDIPQGEMWLGSPAVHNRQVKRQWIAQARLPELLRTVEGLEKKVAALEAALEQAKAK